MGRKSLGSEVGLLTGLKYGFKVCMESFLMDT